MPDISSELFSSSMLPDPISTDDLLEVLAKRADTILRTDSPLHLASFQDSGGPEYLQFDKDYYSILFTFLDPESSLTADDAVLRLNEALPPQAADFTDGYGLAMDLWEILIDIALEIPYDHTLQDKITELVMAFANLPPEVAKESFSDDSGGWYSLRDIPNIQGELRTVQRIRFPEQLRWARGEEVVFPPKPESDYKLDAAQVCRWIRLQAFTARLMGADLQVIASRRYALETLRESALEDPCLRAKHALDVVSCDLQATAMWMIYAGQGLYRSCRQEDNSETAYIRQGALYTGKAGLNLERWKFWKTRYSDLLEDYTELDSNVVAMAKQAVAKMNQAEQEDTELIASDTSLDDQ